MEICNFVNTVDGTHGVVGKGVIGLGSSNLAGRITMLKSFLAYSVASCKGFLPICFQFYREFISSAGKTLTIPVYRVHAW